MKLITSAISVFLLAMTCNANETNVTNFIEHFVEVCPVERGIHIEFTEEYKDIPEDLNAQLKAAFPFLRFYIAKMRWTPGGWDPWRPINVIFVTEVIHHNTITYLWTFDTPETFTRRFEPDMQNTEKLEALAALVAFSVDGFVGSSKREDNVLEVPILSKNDRKWGNLHVTVETWKNGRGETKHSSTLQIIKPNSEPIK